MALAEVRGMALQDPRTWFSSLVAEEQGSWVASWWGINAKKELPPQMGEWSGPEQVAKWRLQWWIAVVEASVKMGRRKSLL